jgi:hypothetical protein
LNPFYLGAQTLAEAIERSRFCKAGNTFQQDVSASNERYKKAFN